MCRQGALLFAYAARNRAWQHAAWWCSPARGSWLFDFHARMRAIQQRGNLELVLLAYCKSREISALLNGTHPRVKVKQPAPARRRRPSAPRPGKIEVPSWTAHQTLQSDTSRVTQGATFGQLFHVDSPTETNGKRSRFVDGSWGAGMAPRSAQSALARLPAATARLSLPHVAWAAGRLYSARRAPLGVTQHLSYSFLRTVRERRTARCDSRVFVRARV